MSYSEICKKCIGNFFNFLILSNPMPPPPPSLCYVSQILALSMIEWQLLFYLPTYPTFNLNLPTCLQTLLPTCLPGYVTTWLLANQLTCPVAYWESCQTAYYPTCIPAWCFSKVSPIRPPRSLRGRLGFLSGVNWFLLCDECSTYALEKP